jgi:hypothetical protein
MKIPRNPIKTSIAKIRSTAVFQRINNARMRQDERMARWVEKKLFPRPTPQQIDPPMPEWGPLLVTDQIGELLISATKLKDEIHSISESSDGSGENFNIRHLTLNLADWADRLIEKLSELDANETAAHLNSRLMQYELQTLQQLAKGVCWAISAKYNESTAVAMAADIAAKAEAILDQMPKAPIDAAYIGEDPALEETEESTTVEDGKGLTPPEPSTNEANDRQTVAKNLLKIFADCAPNYSAGFDHMMEKNEQWKNRQQGEDHVALGAELHHVCLRFRLEIITCLKRMEADPLINKYKRESVENLKRTVLFTTSTIARLETYLEKRAMESSNAETSSSSITRRPVLQSQAY